MIPDPIGLWNLCRNLYPPRPHRDPRRLWAVVLLVSAPVVVLAVVAVLDWVL